MNNDRIDQLAVSPATRSTIRLVLHDLQPSVIWTQFTHLRRQRAHVMQNVRQTFGKWPRKHVKLVPIHIPTAIAQAITRPRPIPSALQKCPATFSVDDAFFSSRIAIGITAQMRSRKTKLKRVTVSIFLKTAFSAAKCASQVLPCASSCQRKFSH